MWLIALELCESLKPDAVAQLHLDYTLVGIRGAFRARVFVGAGLKTAAVNIDQHWVVSTGAGIVWRGDGQSDGFGAFDGGINDALRGELHWLRWGEAGGKIHKIEGVEVVDAITA